MKQVNDRRNEMLQFLEIHMEECFAKSCQSIQEETKTCGYRIWDELRSIINEVLSHAGYLQRLNQKGCIQYVSFSFLKSAIYSGRLELYIGALDDRFYLDEQESAAYYVCPLILQERYVQDINYLYSLLRKQFIRIQNYEWMDIKEQYSMYYNCIIRNMIAELSELIMGVVLKSDIRITDKFKIIYGGYMENADVLYAKDV